MTNVDNSFGAASLTEHLNAVLTAIAAHDRNGGPERVLAKLINQRTDLENEAVRRAGDGDPDVVHALRLVLLSHSAEGSMPSPAILQAIATAIKPFLEVTVH